MLPFSQYQYLQSETEGSSSLGRHGFHLLPVLPTVRGPVFVVGFPLTGTTGDRELSEADMKRLVCYALVHRLPTTGLDEAFESLSEMYEFYSRPVPPPKPLAEPVKKIPAKLGKTYIRPVFPIPDEE